MSRSCSRSRHYCETETRMLFCTSATRGIRTRGPRRTVSRGVTERCPSGPLPHFELQRLCPMRPGNRPPAFARGCFLLSFRPSACNLAVLFRGSRRGWFRRRRRTRCGCFAARLLRRTPGLISLSPFFFVGEPAGPHYLPAAPTCSSIAVSLSFNGLISSMSNKVTCFDLLGRTRGASRERLNIGQLVLKLTVLLTGRCSRQYSSSTILQTSNFGALPRQYRQIRLVE